MDLKQYLQKHFAFSDFRGSQEKVIRHLLEGQNALALMPTGQGKSLCYQFLSRWFAEKEQGLTLVISPLIALMQDQVMQAEKLNLRATFISSILQKHEREARQKQISQGQFDLVFMTPERFRKTEFWECLQNRKISLMTVDEAHCISQWGHDFRPDYSRLPEIKKKLGSPRVLALTATATPDVQTEIKRDLGLDVIISDGLARDNLQISVSEVVGLEEKIEKLKDILRTSPSGSFLIYASLIDTVHKIHKGLGPEFPHLMYHGDLNPSRRKDSLKSFQKQENVTMIATPAFGLGIHKANIRAVVHFELPGSLEAYFQEIGRGGRDGQRAQAHLLLDEDDVSIQMEFIKWSHPEPEFLKTMYHYLESNYQKVSQSGVETLREQMNFKNRRDFRVDSGLNILERWGCLEKTEAPFPYALVRPPTENDFLAESTQEQFKHQNKKLLQMLKWAQNKDSCRMIGIYEYFGHTGSPCGICDNCTDSSR